VVEWRGRAWGTATKGKEGKAAGGRKGLPTMAGGCVCVRDGGGGDVLGLGEGGGLTGWLQFLLGRYIWPVPCGPQGI
jgi:hypothetical protein